ncbi:MAG: DUF2892 domain-containing protein [Gammaproteobacteria bacterium]|nr:DUF2892 domain-containing protein [Gammaproteobacteria bacterium]
MNANIGNVDRLIRLLLGVAILAAGFAFNAWWGVLGIIPLATAAIRWCPAYVPFGFSTCATTPSPKAKH